MQDSSPSIPRRLPLAIPQMILLVSPALLQNNLSSGFGIAYPLGASTRSDPGNAFRFVQADQWESSTACRIFVREPGASGCRRIQDRGRLEIRKCG